MKIGWLERLHAAIEQDGRSMRSISTLSGCGPNYVHQMMKGGKEPGADHLARILDTLGQEAALFVLTGIAISGDDIEFIRLMRGLSPESRADALRFFRGLQSDAGDEVPPPSVDG